MMKKNRGMKIFVIFILLLTINLFSSRKALAWTTRNMTFEAGSLGALAQGGNGLGGAGSATLFSNVRANNGSMSAVMNWTKGSEGWLTAMGHMNTLANIGNGGEVWIRGYFYFASPWSWASNTGTYSMVKVLRAISDSGGMNSILTDSNGAIVLSNEPAQVQNTTSAVLNIDKWQCLELYVKASSSSSGIIRIWKDGVLVGESLGYNLAGSGNVINGIQLMGVWNNGVGQNQTQYIDDFVMTTDTPSQRDSHGNPMIGTISGGSSYDTTPPTTTASPTGNTFTSAQNVTLSANEAATIYYTTNGTTPTTSSATYSSPINISANTTLKYFAKDTTGNIEAIKTQTYTINIPQTYSISNLLTLVTNWLKSGTVSDVNADGTVNARDLGIMMSNWQ